MQQELSKSQFLTLAEDYHKKSVHSEWDGKKAESQRYGRLCAEHYVKALQDNLPDEDRTIVYWRAVLQHQEVRRYKTALELAVSALEFIGENETLARHKPIFEAYVAQNS